MPESFSGGSLLEERQAEVLALGLAVELRPFGSQVHTSDSGGDQTILRSHKITDF
jgi:hypothetical protein